MEANLNMAACDDSSGRLGRIGILTLNLSKPFSSKASRKCACMLTKNPSPPPHRYPAETHCLLQKKIAQSLFCKRPPYGAHFLWHCFHNLMQRHNIYFHPELQSLLAEILHRWQEIRTVPSVFSFNPKYFQWVKVRTRAV